MLGLTFCQGRRHGEEVWNLLDEVLAYMINSDENNSGSGESRRVGYLDSCRHIPKVLSVLILAQTSASPPALSPDKKAPAPGASVQCARQALSKHANFDHKVSILFSFQCFSTKLIPRIRYYPDSNHVAPKHLRTEGYQFKSNHASSKKPHPDRRAREARTIHHLNPPRSFHIMRQPNCLTDFSSQRSITISVEPTEL